MRSRSTPSGSHLLDHNLREDPHGKVHNIKTRSHLTRASSLDAHLDDVPDVPLHNPLDVRISFRLYPPPSVDEETRVKREVSARLHCLTIFAASFSTSPSTLLSTFHSTMAPDIPLHSSLDAPLEILFDDPPDVLLGGSLDWAPG